jgi:beta-glucanase (GH16 family)
VGALLLNEDFSTQTSLNTKIWTPDWFTPTSKQNGVTTDPKNVSLVNGQLVLTLASATDGAAVSSNPDDGVSGHTGFQFTYGYVEASITFPSVSGKLVNWPAFWTNGQNWPATEEFDIAEVLGGNMTTNYHSAALPNGGNSGTIPGTWTGKHVYSELWTSGKQTVYFDGVEVFSRSCNATGAPQYLIFTHGVSGTPAIGAMLLIDYVRVWELA